MAREATLKLGIDATGARRGAGQFERSTRRVSTASGRAEARIDSLKRSTLALGTAFGFLKRQVFGLPALIGALGAGGIGLLSKNMVKAASDAEELQNVFSTVFKGLSKESEAAANALAEKLKVSVVSVKESMAGFGDSFVPIGLARKDALELSKTVTELSFNLQSFKNKSFEETFNALQSAIAGENESVRRQFGVFLTQSRIQAEALKLGLVDTNQELSVQAKVLATLSIIAKDTADAEDDLIKTQDSWANQMRRLGEAIKDVQVELGDDLVRALQKGIREMGGMDSVIGIVRLALVGVGAIASEVVTHLANMGSGAAKFITDAGGMEVASNNLRNSLRGLSVELVRMLSAVQIPLEFLIAGFRTLVFVVKGSATAIALVVASLAAVLDDIAGKLRGLASANGNNPFGRAVREAIGLSGLEDSISDFAGISRALAESLASDTGSAFDKLASQMEAAEARVKAAFLRVQELQSGRGPGASPVTGGQTIVEGSGGDLDLPAGFGTGPLLPQTSIKLQRILDAHKKNADAIRDIYQRLGADIGFAIGNAFEDLIFSGGKLRDALKRIFEDIGRIMFRQFVTQNIANSLSGLFAGGAAFSQGNVIPFASGGVVGGPSMFGMSGGKTGLMGEAGPEAVMPLTRGSDGKLGVKSEGGGGVVQNFYITTPDAGSFRKSKRQIADDMRRAI